MRPIIPAGTDLEDHHRGGVWSGGQEALPRRRGRCLVAESSSPVSTGRGLSRSQGSKMAMSTRASLVLPIFAWVPATQEGQSSPPSGLWVGIQRCLCPGSSWDESSRVAI